MAFAKDLGFDFVEMSVDESDDRLARLEWSKEERLALVKAIYETGCGEMSFSYCKLESVSVYSFFLPPNPPKGGLKN